MEYSDMYLVRNVKCYLPIQILLINKTENLMRIAHNNVVIGS